MLEAGVTEVQRSFSDYINRVVYREESFRLVRGGRPVADLMPVRSGARLGDLPDLLAGLPPLGRSEGEAFTRELGWGRGRGGSTETQAEAPAGSEPGETPTGSGPAGGPPETAEPEGTEAASGPPGDEPTGTEGSEPADPEGPEPAGSESPAAAFPDPRAVLLDAVVLLDREAQGLDPVPRTAGREEVPFHLSVITVGELFRVADRVREPIRRGRRLAWVEAVAERFPLLPGDLATARTHGELWGRLADEGVRLGPHDLWLTAACVAHGFVLGTSDPARFQGLPGLALADWSERG